MNACITSFCINTIGFFIAFAIIIWTYFKWSFQYWERKDVPFLPPTIPFGNGDGPIWRKRNAGTITRDIYNGLKSKGARFGGFYVVTRPVFIAIDPEVIRSVLAKDFRCEHITLDFFVIISIREYLQMDIRLLIGVYSTF